MLKMPIKETHKILNWNPDGLHFQSVAEALLESPQQALLQGSVGSFTDRVRLGH